MENNFLNPKSTFITSVVFFIVINTSYYWEPKLGLLAFPSLALLLLIYMILLVIFLQHIFLIIKEKFANRQRITVNAVLFLVLVLTFFKPNGLIKFDKLSGEDLLVAQREGAANCMTTLKLKDNNKFIETTICFGITEVKGSYKKKGDTIFFNTIDLGRYNSSYYSYAVIKRKDTPNKNMVGEIIKYRSEKDTVGNVLWIIKISNEWRSKEG
jgi:hypothetical protein